jgi:hypothetical protein
MDPGRRPFIAAPTPADNRRTIRVSARRAFRLRRTNSAHSPFMRVGIIGRPRLSSRPDSRGRLCSLKTSVKEPVFRRPSMACPPVDFVSFRRTAHPPANRRWPAAVLASTGRPTAFDVSSRPMRVLRTPRVRISHGVANCRRYKSVCSSMPPRGSSPASGIASNRQFQHVVRAARPVPLSVGRRRKSRSGDEKNHSRLVISAQRLHGFSTARSSGRICQQSLNPAVSRAD